MTRQFIRFALAGVVGFVVDAGVLYLALALGTGPYLGRALSFLAAVFTTWQINRSFTFERVQHRSLWREWHEYLLAMAIGGACNYAVYALALHILPASRYAPLFAVGLGSIAGMFVNFVSAKYWVFKKAKDQSAAH